MAKLKFDRILKVTVARSESIVIPVNEVWKCTLIIDGEVYINGAKFDVPINSGTAYQKIKNMYLAEGTKISGYAVINGIVFKKYD